MSRLSRSIICLLTLMTFLVNGVGAAYLVTADHESDPSLVSYDSNDYSALDETQDVSQKPSTSTTAEHDCNHGCLAASHLLSLVGDFFHFSGQVYSSSRIPSFFTLPLLPLLATSIYKPPR